MRILVVEDEPRVSSLLERGLREEGDDPVVVESLGAARRALAGAEPPFELLLIDRMLPDGDGLELVHEVREQGMDLAVLVLTAMDQVG